MDELAGSIGQPISIETCEDESAAQKAKKLKLENEAVDVLLNRIGQLNNKIETNGGATMMSNIFSLKVLEATYTTLSKVVGHEYASQFAADTATQISALATDRA